MQRSWTLSKLWVRKCADLSICIDLVGNTPYSSTRLREILITLDSNYWRKMIAQPDCIILIREMQVLIEVFQRIDFLLNALSLLAKPKKSPRVSLQSSAILTMLVSSHFHSPSKVDVYQKVSRGICSSVRDALLFMVIPFFDSIIFISDLLTHWHFCQDKGQLLLHEIIFK